MRLLYFSSFLAALAMSASGLQAQELFGAQEALRQAKAAADAKKLGTDPTGAFQAKLDAYRKASPSMDAAGAAKGWIELLAAYDLAVSNPNPTSYQGTPFNGLVEALPQPEAWPQIAKALKARAPKSKTDVKSPAFSLLAEILVGTPDSQWKEMAKILAANQADKSGYSSQIRGQALQLYQALAVRTGDKERTVRAITLQAALPGNDQSLVLPDLVGLVGKARATQIIADLLKTTSKPISIGAGRDTLALAMDIAHKNMATMKAAQWSLVADPSATKLYEAMLKRFGAPKAQGQNYGALSAFYSARFNYLLGLLKENRVAEATKVAGQIGSQSEFSYVAYRNRAYIDTLANSPAALKFLEQVARAKATSPFWDLYISVATRAGTINKVVESLQAAAAKPNLKAEELEQIQTQLVAAYLASDQVESAVNLLKKKAAANNSLASTYGIQIASIGHLVKRKAWVDEGLALYQKGKSAKRPGYEYGFYTGSSATPVLLALGLTSEAERALIDSYVKTDDRESGFDMANPILSQLAVFYQSQNRPEDVKLLLDQAPNWGVRDVADLVSASSWSNYYDSSSPVGGAAAWALAKTGKKAEALQMVYRLLANDPTSDATYELLIELAGDEAMARLDAIYHADPFEERSLIWKAVLLKKQGKLEEAEKVSRQAISIDPSDGETKNGRRLFAYSVLADIREARGEKEDAANLRQAVAAIRHAEEADKFMELGMIRRSIDMYKDALVMFNNAYCIQSRLAIQLMQQGRVKEAEEHYRRAYELMPDSFGRVETHCFGCEQAFEGEVAQNIAEQVFAEFAAKNPKKPQVHYLLGYLRKEQGRYTEALASYRKAVELDPDYLNAWKEIHLMGQMILLAESEQKKVATALLRLDPLQRHETQHNMGGVSPAEIWRTTDRATKAFLTESAGSIYPLTASQLQLDQKKDDEMGMEMRRFSFGMESRKVTSPGGAIAQIDVVRYLLALIESGGMFSDMD